MIAWLRRLFADKKFTTDEDERNLIVETRRRQRAAELELKKIEAAVSVLRRGNQ